jgi:hypothetical protein
MKKSKIYLLFASFVSFSFLGCTPKNKGLNNNDSSKLLNQENNTIFSEISEVLDDEIEKWNEGDDQPNLYYDVVNFNPEYGYQNFQDFFQSLKAGSNEEELDDIKISEKESKSLNDKKFLENIKKFFLQNFFEDFRDDLNTNERVRSFFFNSRSENLVLNDREFIVKLIKLKLDKIVEVVEGDSKKNEIESSGSSGPETSQSKKFINIIREKFRNDLSIVEISFNLSVTINSDKTFSYKNKVYFCFVESKDKFISSKEEIKKELKNIIEEKIFHKNKEFSDYKYDNRKDINLFKIKKNDFIKNDFIEDLIKGNISEFKRRSQILKFNDNIELDNKEIDYIDDKNPFIKIDRKDLKNRYIDEKQNLFNSWLNETKIVNPEANQTYKSKINDSTFLEKNKVIGFSSLKLNNLELNKLKLGQINLNFVAFIPKPDIDAIFFDLDNFIEGHNISFSINNQNYKDGVYSLNFLDETINLKVEKANFKNTIDSNAIYNLNNKNVNDLLKKLFNVELSKNDQIKILFNKNSEINWDDTTMGKIISNNTVSENFKFQFKNNYRDINNGFILKYGLLNIRILHGEEGFNAGLDSVFSNPYHNHRGLEGIRVNIDYSKDEL